MDKLETIIINGKPGTVAYFDAEGDLTTPDVAVAAKVVFEDGEHLWLWAPWDEVRPS
jgi:hypothetical protein